MSARPRLCLDISPLLEDQWTGIPVFARRLVTSLVQSQKVDLEYAVSLTKIPTARVEDTIRCGFGTFLRTEVSRTGFSGLGKVDPSVPLLYPSVKLSFGLSGQEASVVHDMSTLVMPETHAPANVAHHMDPLCDELATDETVFCVSEATRQALQLAFPSVRGRTRVLYQYADWPEEFDLIDRNMPQLALPPFAAVVGTIEPRKNLNLLLRALEHPDVMATDMSFVIIGKRGWRLDEALAGLSDTARNRLIFTGFVSEFIKYRLLKAAQFLIFPSIYESVFEKGIPARRVA